MVEEEQLDQARFDFGLMRRLLRYLKPYTRWVLLTFVLILGASAAQQAGPYLTKIAVDDAIVPGKPEGLNNIVLIYILLTLAQFGLSYFQGWVTTMVGQWTMRDIRMGIFSHLQRLPLQFYDRTPIGLLMTRNTSDVDTLNDLFTDGIVTLISDLLTVVTILAFICLMDIKLGLLVCILLPFVFAITRWFQSRTFQTFRIARVRFGRFTTFLQETISGIEVVHLFSDEQRQAKRFEEANNGYLAARLKGSLYHSFYFPFMELCGVLLLALILWYGGGAALQHQMDWGVLVAMLQYGPRFFMPIRDIAERFQTLQTAMASAERIFELLDEPPEPPGGDVKQDAVRGAVEFRNVWFAYIGEEWVLQDVSFSVEPGQSVAFVGATGAGKSTLINLISRFYAIQKGDILVDGVNIREWDVERLRRHIGLVQQDVFLFAGDVESNIRLNDPSITREQVERAARMVNADRFIEALPDGYAQTVQERGSSFSSGQRQLLSFARALAFDPAILILDEATVSVDTETEQWIQEAMKTLMSDRTALIIAHRLSTIRHVDRIFVLHRGRIREEGSHEELLRLNGVYAHLYQLQQSEGD